MPTLAGPQNGKASMEDDALTNVKSGSISTCPITKPVAVPEVASQIASGTNVCGKTAMTTATHRFGSQFEISLESPEAAVLSDGEDSVCSCDITDTVSIPDKETLDKNIELNYPGSIVRTLREDQPLRLLLNLLFYYFNCSKPTYKSQSIELLDVIAACNRLSMNALN